MGHAPRAIDAYAPVREVVDQEPAAVPYAVRQGWLHFAEEVDSAVPTTI